MALCVWKVDHDAFYKFDEWLFAVEYPRLASEARAKAIELVGESRLEDAWADPIIGKQLKFGAEIYRMCKFGRIPKLLDNNRVFSGRVENPAELQQVLATEFRVFLDPPKTETSEPEASFFVVRLANQSQPWSLMPRRSRRYSPDSIC